MAELATFRLRPGDRAPDFDLPNVDGRRVRRSDFADRRLLLVVFWCNHCPYVQAWEGRMIELGQRYQPQGVGIVLINSNDVRAYPQDRPEMMAKRAQEKGYPFPYLFDATQEVARAYGALVTPHPMLFDAQHRLLFQGPIDDNHERREEVRSRPLAEAIEAALAGRPIARPALPVRGCSIKWADGA
ncbi:MAG: thioredoxin family protein [Thermoplasmata archaeon]